MATRVPIRLQFDHDLPLFSAKVKGHLVEIYFYGTMPTGSVWKMWVDSDEYDSPSLEACWAKAQEVLSQRTGLDIKYFYTREDS